MSKIMAAVVVSALFATPAVALAARAHHAYAQAPVAAGGPLPMSAARYEAIRQCTAEEQKYNQVSWGDYEIDVYRACMAAHNQPE